MYKVLFKFFFLDKKKSKIIIIFNILKLSLIRFYIFLIIFNCFKKGFIKVFIVENLEKIEKL